MKTFFKKQILFPKNVKLLVSFFSICILALTIFFALEIRKMNTNYSFSEFFPQQHPLLNQSQQVRQNFQIEEHSSFLLMLHLSQGNWLEKSKMTQLETLTHKLQNLPHITNATSFANIDGAVETEGALMIGPLYKNIPYKRRVASVQSNPLIYGQLVSKNMQTALIALEPEALSPQELKSLQERILKTAQTMMPKVSVELGGAPEVQRQFSEKLGKELFLFLGICFAVFCLVFYALISGYSSLIFTFASLALVNIFVLGLLSLLKVPFSILLSTLPIIVSVAIVSVIIHTLHRWAEVVEEDSSYASAYDIWKEMLLPNLLGSLTTALGFAALANSNIPLIKKYGLVVSLSVVAAWALTQLLLLVYMPLLKPRLRSWFKHKSLWTLSITKYAAEIFIVTLVVTVIVGVHGSRMKFGGQLFDDLSKHDSARIASQRIDQKLGGVVTYDLELNTQSEGFWKSAGSLVRLNSFVNSIRKQPGVGSVSSVIDLLGKDKIHNQATLSEALFLFSMSPQNPVINYLSEDGKRLRLSIRFHDLDTKNIEYLRSWIRYYAYVNFPKAIQSESGFGYVAHVINKEVSMGLVFGFWHSMLLIAVLLSFVFRSVRWALVACIPNLIPPIFLFGFMGITNVDVKPGVAIIFSIALGLAFNNTVYFLARLKTLQSKKKLNHLLVRKTLLQEGNPCLFETIIMFCGFAIFLVSNFKANETFGVYMLLSILVGAYGDIVFLPAMLKLFPRLLIETAEKSRNKASNAMVRDLDSSSVSKKEIEIQNPLTSNVIMIFAFLFAGFTYFAPITSLAETKVAISSADKAEVQKIFELAKSNLKSSDESAVVTMKIIEKNGDAKIRKMQMKAKSGEKFYSLIRLSQPADIKGTALLSVASKDSESQWLYTPSSKQVRRIVSAKKSSGILGSELSTEDLNTDSFNSAASKIIKKTAQSISIEVKLNKKTGPFDRAITSFSSTLGVPLKTEYFNNNKLYKSVEFLNYKKINNKVLRASLIKVKNHQNGRGTDLEFEDIKVNQGLRETEFTPSSLRN